MKAIEISAPGAPEVLRLVDRPDPVSVAGEALVRVHAAGVNRPDILQRKGLYPPPAGASDLPGLEIAGVIEAGDLAGTGWRIGDPVCALVSGGGYAQRCAVPVGQMLPVPDGLSYAEAASLPETCFTVWSNVFERGALAPGEWLLVQGGASGIGVMAIQIAVARGSPVLATAGTGEKCRAIEALGAGRAIDYRREDFVAVVGEVTGGRGVDVILDMVAGDYVAREIECLAEDGRLVIIAVQGGTAARFDASRVLRRRLSITGSALRPRPVAFKAALAARLRAEVWPLINAGRVKPVLYRVLPLAEAADAHALLESGSHVGKIVLAVSDAANERP
jgi:NADPH2:quinone reductase